MSKFLFPIIIFVLAAFFIYRTWTNHKVADENFAKGQAFLLENAKKRRRDHDRERASIPSTRKRYR